MQITVELVTYDENLNKFTPDENVYGLELDEESAETYKLLKDKDLHLYNWIKESEFFLNWIKTEIYPDSIGKKFAISDINGISFLRFYFFKITSGESHYEYFKKLFNIVEESDWQDREDIGEEILEYLPQKQKELIIEITEKSDDTKV